MGHETNFYIIPKKYYKSMNFWTFMHSDVSIKGLKHLIYPIFLFRLSQFYN